MKNVLFVLYGNFGTNSGHHIHALANALQCRGFDCIAATQKKISLFQTLHRPLYKACRFYDALTGNLNFQNSKGVDIIHAWTPRERVRKFCNALRKQNPQAKLVIHLEDNEEFLFHSSIQSEFGLSDKDLLNLEEQELNAIVRNHLSHPKYYSRFLGSADGLTLLIDKLKSFIPSVPNKLIPHITFWPAADETLFYPRTKEEASDFRARYRIPSHHTVLAYAGNTHAANAHEVQSLYLAVSILNREGHPTTLLRAGTNHYPLFDQNDSIWKKYVIELGQLNHHEIPLFLNAADLMVQPGEPGDFNDYRFPSKLPEFFAMGKPVLLPRTNVGLHTEHLIHAYVLPKANALEIVHAVQNLMHDANLYRTLQNGALEFSKNYLSWEKSANRLAAFYASLN